MRKNKKIMLSLSICSINIKKSVKNCQSRMEFNARRISSISWGFSAND